MTFTNTKVNNCFGIYMNYTETEKNQFSSVCIHHKMVRNWSFEVQFWLFSANHLQHSQSACTKSTIHLCALYYMRIFGRKLELTLNPFFKLFLLSLRLTYILTSDVRRRRFWNFTWREQRSHLDSHDRCKDKTFPENHVKNVFLKVWLYFEFRMNMGFPRTKKKTRAN